MDWTYIRFYDCNINIYDFACNITYPKKTTHRIKNGVVGKAEMGRISWVLPSTFSIFVPIQLAVYGITL